MRQYRYIIALGLFIVLTVTTGTGTVSAADKPRFKQYIAPLECVIDVVNNGVTTKTILTPQECYDYFNPLPPSDGDGDHSDAPVTSPKSPVTTLRTYKLNQLLLTTLNSNMSFDTLATPRFLVVDAAEETKLSDNESEVGTVIVLTAVVIAVAGIVAALYWRQPEN